MNRRSLFILIGLSICCAIAFGARLTLSPDGVVEDAKAMQLIYSLRLVSACAAVIVGVSLATSGVYLQSLLRNPLASPYILGLAAGAGLGIKVFEYISRQIQNANAINGSSIQERAGVADWLTDQVGAGVGVGVVLIVVYALSQRRGMVDPMGLLLVGVMVSAVCGALIMLLQFLSPIADSDQLIRWMMGTISQLWDMQSLAIAGGIVCIGVVIGVLYAPALDASSLGDDEAISVGVNLRRLRLILFITASVLTALAVVLAGPIGFVGLVAPHVGRKLVGPRHRPLILASALIGAGLLLFADTAVRWLPRTHGIMPIGIMTAGIGGPIFIWLLRRERHHVN